MGAPPRSTPATCPCNNLLGRPASSQTFLQGSCLLWELQELTWPWNRSQPPISARAVSCVILPSRLFFLFVCFFLGIALTSGDVATGLSISACRVKRVSMVSVNYNKHRLKCLPCHDVCDLMGYHIQCHCCYMIKCVCSTCIQTSSKPPLAG